MKKINLEKLISFGVVSIITLFVFFEATERFPEYAGAINMYLGILFTLFVFGKDIDRGRRVLSIQKRE